jgi:hypothetical protein
VLDEPRHEVLQRFAAPARDPSEDGPREEVAAGDDAAPDAGERGSRMERAEADAGRDASRAPAEPAHQPTEQSSGEPTQPLLDPDRRASVARGDRHLHRAGRDAPAGRALHRPLEAASDRRRGAHLTELALDLEHQLLVFVGGHFTVDRALESQDGGRAEEAVRRLVGDARVEIGGGAPHERRVQAGLARDLLQLRERHPGGGLGRRLVLLQLGGAFDDERDFLLVESAIRARPGIGHAARTPFSASSRRPASSGIAAARSR